MIDPVSGYPFEGWNQDPAAGALPPLVHPVDGHRPVHGAAREHRRRQSATARTSRATRPSRTWRSWSRACARTSTTRGSSADGLLGNFLDLATGKRLGPLASDVEKTKLLDAFGTEKGEAIWKALAAKGWIVPRQRTTARPTSSGRATFGWDHFDGPLAPYRDTGHEAEDHGPPRPARGDGGLRRQRQPLVVRRPKTIGALLRPAIKDEPGVAASCGGSWSASSTTSARVTPGCTTRRPASSTSAGTPPRTATSAGTTCRGTGSRGTSTTSSTSSAARPRSSSSGSACRSTPSRTSASRSSRTG